MATLVEPSLYNALPSLEDANERKLAMSVEDVMNGPIRDVFLKHFAHNFCLYLQHAHHLIHDGEAIVKVEGTAHLMNSADIKELASFGNKVVPTTWMTFNGSILPMEFTIAPAEAATPTPTKEFLSEFLSILTASGCHGLFGLDTMCKYDWAETKIGEASVVVPINGSASYDQEKFIEVGFAFDENSPKFRVHGKCGKGQHKHSSKPK